jgi:lipoprotein-anchoring transpeptidase ErfK/SrfK
MIGSKSTRKDSPMRRIDTASRLTACVLAALLAAQPALAATNARGDSAQSAPPRASAPELPAAPDELKPGEFEWQPGWDAESRAPVMVMVSLDEQRAYVYREGQRIGTSTVSSGKPGHETPTGVFEILQKQKLHHSNLYQNERTGAPAPMPWMQRLSWDGVALHAGRVRARPASHGCVRLPDKFAQQLYTITERGGLVVISENVSIDALLRAGLEAPLAIMLNSAASLPRIAREESAGRDARATPASLQEVAVQRSPRTALNP